MSSHSDPNPSIPTSASQDALAIELGNVRQHFGVGTGTTATGQPGRSRIQDEDTLVDRRSPLPLDNAFVQQTKDQIRSIVENIAVLANSPIDPSQFVNAALPMIVQAMGAKGAGLWQALPNSHWRLLGNFQLPMPLLQSVDNDEPTTDSNADGALAEMSRSPFDTLDFLENQIREVEVSKDMDELGASPSPSKPHLLILNAVSREKQPILIPPGNVSLVRDRPVNPIEDLLVLAPLPIPKELGEYWLQVVQSPSGGPSSQRGYLRFVAQMADLISDHFRSFRLRVFERDRNYLSLAEHTMNDLSAGMPAAQGLSRLMSIIREHAHSEHVFLLRRDSNYGRWRVAAAAGLVEIDRRADGIEQIETTAKVFDSMYTSGGLLQVEQIAETVDSRDPDLTRMIQTFAVTEAMWVKPLSMSGETSRKTSRKDVALLLTWAGLDRPPARCQEQTGLIARLGLSALQIPWWKTALYASKNYHPSLATRLRPSAWPRSLKWLIAMALLGGALAIPVPIRLHATAVLVPKVQQHVYAPLDSIVEKVLVEHGQKVAKGTPLIQLQSPNLTAEYDQCVAQQLRNAQRVSDIDAKLLRETSLTSAERDELEGEREALKGVQEVERLRLDRLRDQLDSMLIVAELDGVIATWNLQDNLRNRPLRTGQWLLSLHEEGSNWAFEASLPESEAFEFRQAMRQEKEAPTATLIGTPQRPIRVHYVPDHLPRIEQAVTGPSNPASKEALLRMRFDVDPLDITERQTIAGATARISIPNGRGPLAWALTKDFIRKVWTQVQMWI